MEMSTASRVGFEELYAAQWRNMVRLAVLLVDDRSAAEDVVQEAFVGVYRRPPRDPDAVVAYLRACVVNGARSALRRRATAPKHVSGRGVVVTDHPDDVLPIAAEHADLIAALRQLPRRQREVLVLRYWSRLSEAEIAAALGVSLGTVKSTARRGLQALETIMEGSR